MRHIRVTNPFTKQMTIEGVKINPKKTNTIGLYTAEKAPLVASLKKRGYIVRLVEVEPVVQVTKKDAKESQKQGALHKENNSQSTDLNKSEPSSDLKNPAANNGSSLDHKDGKAATENKKEPNKSAENHKKEDSSSNKA